MQPISLIPHALCQVVENNELFGIKKGMWWKQPKFLRFFDKIFGLDSYYNQELIKETTQILVRSEKEKIFINRHTRILTPEEGSLLADYHKLAVTVFDKLKNKEVFKEDLHELKKHIVALEYRLSPLQAVKKLKNEELFSKMQKRKQACPMRGIKELTLHDETQILRASHYPKFIKLLLKNERLFQQYAEWIFSGNQTDVFVQYPAKCQSLMEGSLHLILGFCHQHILRLETSLDANQRPYKNLTFLFEGVRTSILDDEQMVKFKYDYCFKVKEVFRLFRQREERFIDLEFDCHKGIVNFNSSKFGSYDPILGDYHYLDFTQKDWYKQLPCSQILTSSEALEIFKDEKGDSLAVTGSNWLIGLVGTSVTDYMDVKGTHAYLALGIPTGNQRYGLYSFGRFAKQLPPELPENLKTLRQKIAQYLSYFKILSNVVEAVIVSPDPNTYYNRFSRLIAHTASPEEAEQILAKIVKDILKARDGKLFFQIFFKSCVHWVFKIIRYRVDDVKALEMSGIALMEATPSGAIGLLYKFLRKFSPATQRKILNFLFRLLQPNTVNITDSKGRVKRLSILRTPPWQEGSLCLHPAALMRYQVN